MKRQKHSPAGKKGKKAGLIVLSALLVVMLVATVLCATTFRSILGTVLGGKKPKMAAGTQALYTSDYASKEEAKKAGDALNLEIAKEGFTLLVNENKALPLAAQERRVSVFGKNSVNLVLSGSGSGKVSSDEAKTIFDGLADAGIAYNPELVSFYQSADSGKGRSDNPATADQSKAAPTLNIGETPVASYPKSLLESYKEYGDAAIVVISRIGGESFDLPRSQNVKEGGIEGSHYLQLDQNEYDMLDMVTARFDKVIVVLNTLTAFQCDFIEQYNNDPANPRIDAVVWIGGPSTNGAQAIGRLLTGEDNFSGRTVDLYARDFTKDPTWQNFGDNSQVNGGLNGNAFMDGPNAADDYYVAYEEGIYVGYRYYETRGYEESLRDASEDWYADNVIFPFGYGLSYTEFEQTMTMEGELQDADSRLTFTVKVKNTGDVAGKDVVQLYASLPYIRGGIEKSHVQLVDFAKTRLLAPGEEEEITFTVTPYQLASYDNNDANRNGFTGYELDAGAYRFFIAKNSHIEGEGNVYASAQATLAAGLTYTQDPDTGALVGNLYTYGENYDGVEKDGVNFGDVQYRLSDVYVEADGAEVVRKGMSRTDFEKTFPQAATAAERIYLDGERDALRDRSTNNGAIAAMLDAPVTGADGTMTLRELIGLDYSDEKWAALLDQLTAKEMLDLVNQGAFQTVSIARIKKNLTNDSDGPVGFVNFMPGLKEHYTGNSSFACEILLASTWNKDLAYQMGKNVGDIGVWGDVSGNQLPYTGWYAPAVNLHRSPFSGRNYEYYSEDPVISGRMAVNVINGAKQKGVYTDLKHFALNDQETARGGIATYCTEQALRELYLKPFEMGVKGSDDVNHSATAVADGLSSFSGTTGVMSSFNRIGTRWTGGDYRLLTQILRGEWGYEGLVICDYKTDNKVMDSRQMLYAGNDLILASLPDLLWNDCDFGSAQDMQVLRNAAHNILYTVANSNSMNVDIVGYSTEPWLLALIGVDVLLALALAACIAGRVRRRKKAA